MRIASALSLGFGLGSLLVGCHTSQSSTPSSSAPPKSSALDAKAKADAAPAAAASAWLDKRLSADQRAELLLHAMTQEEKLALLTGYFGVQSDWNKYQFKEARRQSAGFVPGVPRLGFTAQWQTDSGSGVSTQREAPPELERTALPSGLLTAATWDPSIAEKGGAMIGNEARATGFNVMLAGGVNLTREAFNGRNFEYGGEDPLLAGLMVGALVRGIQSNHIVATVKHFALNNQETGRDRINVVIDEAAARMSDLLAFQIAIEQGDPGSVMCSYNLINGAYACQNEWLLNQVLKHDWGFKGYVMSDWGAQHDTVLNANYGLDQETGVADTGKYQWLDKLATAIRQNQVPQARLDDMARRVARTLIEKGAVDEPVTPGPIDFAAHAQVTQADAEDGIVLLKNQGVLPLAAKAQRIALIGGHADVGVLSGGGSAQVYAPGGNAVPGLGSKDWPGPIVYTRSSPLEALRAELPKSTLSWQSGADLEAASSAAKLADIAIVFVTQWTTESLDFPLSLPDEQDRLIAAVARANKRTVVVLETGGAVLMPWLDQVAGVVEAWYPGSRGGPAIARVLSGAVNPSGHLPLTFPRKLEQLPRSKPTGDGSPAGTRLEVHYDEGAAVGYRWYGKKAFEPLFPFGHGLSYTTFAQKKLSARVDNGELKVTFTVSNTGKRAGKTVAQVYVAPEAGGWEAPKRLAAFGKVELTPGASRELTLSVDARLLANYEPERRAFRVAPGVYRVTLANSATEPGQSVTVTLGERIIAPHPG
ncbi:MAG TPA: glycoside hydrolase family 3 C-terminal domain-containing protein [Polyangiaceae bacterium]|nr:glycoside hydrolase family 3 C-terminal domain-containing protein [Polyangiaceae bacterium]